MPEHEVVRAAVAGRPADRDRRRDRPPQALGYPPFGALAELTGDDAALRIAVDALPALDVRAFGPSDGRVLVHAPDWERARVARCTPCCRRRAPLGRLRVAVDPPRV